MKTSFKAEKVTLFIVNKDVQDFLFGPKMGDKVRNFRKLLVGQSQVFALFDKEDDFEEPVFESIKKANRYIYNNKVIQVPIREKNQLMMCLFMVFKGKMKA